MSEVAGLFVGIGMCGILLAIAYLLYQIGRFIKSNSDLEGRYCLLEECFIDKVAKKKDMDLDKEAIKKGLMRKEEKSLRGKIREEMMNEMFGKEKP